MPGSQTDLGLPFKIIEESPFFYVVWKDNRKKRIATREERALYERAQALMNALNSVLEKPIK